MKILSSKDFFPASQTHAPWHMHVSNDHTTVNWAFCDIFWGKVSDDLTCFISTEFQKGMRNLISEPYVVASLQDAPLPPPPPQKIPASRYSHPCIFLPQRTGVGSRGQ